MIFIKETIILPVSWNDLELFLPETTNEFYRNKNRSKKNRIKYIGTSKEIIFDDPDCLVGIPF